jgi:PhnB protein
MFMSVAAAEPAVKPIPEGYHTITPYLVVGGAAEAIEFYKRAFGAVELTRALTPDGTKIMNASIKIGDSIIMLNDEFPEMNCKGPLTLGGSPFNLHIYVEDADAVFEQAVAAGATITMPIADMFWGDRYGSVTDPFGHNWGIATHKREMTEADLTQMAADWENCTSEASQQS